MATRMQQRRGTAAQWTAANPILASGEIGFETDTNKFKMGNGTSTWSALVYFANAVELVAAIDSVVGMAPETLNTLSEISDALGDDPNFLSGLVTNTRFDLAALGGAQALEEARTYLSNSIQSHVDNTINVHGIEDTLALATKGYADNAVSAHQSDTMSVHGIADTAALATKTYADNAIAALTKTSIGLSDVDNTSDASKPVSAAQEYAIAEAKTEAITAAGSAADTKVSDHNLLETNVHGIPDTSVLATLTDITNAVDGAVVDQSTLAGTGLYWNSVDTQFEVDETHITEATETALDLKAPLANPTFTGTVEGITKSMVGLENVDNTSDADKPISTATQDALDLKAPISAPSFTGNANFESNVTIEGNLLVEGTTTTVNTSEVQIDDPIFYLSANQYDANTRDIGITGAYGTVGGTEANHLHTGLVKDVTDGKWKLFSNTPHPVNNVVDFTSANYDTLKVGPLEATTVNASSGIVFSDGTQTKLGVPSVTTFATAISSSATLAAGEADKFVPLTGAVTITLPATGYSTGQSIDFYQASGTGAQFSDANGVVGTPGRKFRTTNSVVTAMKTSNGWLIFGDLAL
jgi:hypothetical protein